MGDDVVCYDRERPRSIVGELVSDYEWLPDLVPEKPHSRRVTWTREVSRDLLSTATKNALGSILAFFKVNAGAAADLEHYRP